MDSSREPSRETLRARPVAGGKSTCAHCSEPRGPGTAYCAAHKREYDRAWRARRTEEFHALKAMAEQSISSLPHRKKAGT